MSTDEEKPNRKRSHMETLEFPFQIQSLRLEAIFYPKFENETGERVIRNRMLSSSSTDSYIEVSTKHSGSDPCFCGRVDPGSIAKTRWTINSRQWEKCCCANTFADLHHRLAQKLTCFKLAVTTCKNTA